MKAPIHSEKHYFQMSFATVGTLAAATQVVAHAVTMANKNAVNEVLEGSIIKAVYVELWTVSSASDGSEIVTILKDTQDLGGPTFAEMAALGSYNNKKNILFTHQGLSANDGINNPTPVIRGWIKIPKSKQRFGLGDKFLIVISNPSANDLDFCGFATYKEYT